MQLRAMSGLVVLILPRTTWRVDVSAPKYMCYTEAHADGRGMGCNLKPCYCLRAWESWPHPSQAAIGDGMGVGEPATIGIESGLRELALPNSDHHVALLS